MRRFFATLLTLLIVTGAQAQWTYDGEIVFPAEDSTQVMPYLSAVADDGTLYVISSSANDTAAHNALWKAAPGSTMMELVEDYSDPRDANVHSTRGIATYGNDVIVSSQSAAQPGGIGFAYLYYYENGDPDQRTDFSQANGYSGYGTFIYGMDVTSEGYLFAALSYNTSIRAYDFTDPESGTHANWIALLDDGGAPRVAVDAGGHDGCAWSALRDIALVPGMDYTSTESRFFTSRNETGEGVPDGCGSYDGGVTVWEGATAETWADYEPSRITDFFGDLSLSSFVPTGITADKEGRLWLAGPDSTRRWVKVFTITGDVAMEEFELPSATGTTPVEDGAPFVAPTDVSLNANEDRAYVIDLLARRVFTFSRITTSSEQDRGMPDEFTLLQNYPNPFNPTTRIEFELTSTAPVRLAVYDVLGREVAVLIDETRSAGRHAVNFTADHLTSGVYLYRLESNGRNQTRALLLSK